MKVVDYWMIGATGRVYLSGEESDVRAAAEAAERALEARGMSNGSAGLTPDELRDAVRAVLREVLPSRLVTADHGTAAAR